MLIDIDTNRRSNKYSSHELFGRVLWTIASPVFRFSPRLLWSWRNGLLRLFGAKIGEGVRVYQTARIMMPWNLTLGDRVTIGDGVVLYALGPISIGARATISQGAHLCAGTHDYCRSDFPLRKPPITIGEDVWVCAEAFIGPGVQLGAYAIAGARSVVMRDVESWVIVRGNPATFYKQRPGISRAGSISRAA
jgi:putative colanic acid biosynthesis acetyltransferase WcaF